MMRSTTIWTCRHSCVEMTSSPLGPWRVELVPGVDAWFSGAVLPGASDGNLAHHRPHLPAHLASAREAFAAVTRTDTSTWHLMRQVHGADVAIIDASTPSGAELRHVDAVVTTQVERPLVVLVADCLPVLMAGRMTVAAVHAGWRGITADAPGAAVRAMVGLGERAADIRVAIGPAIGPCCYEVGPDVLGPVGSMCPAALATTRDGRPSVDLFVAATALLAAAGVDGPTDRSPCTHCGPSLFSHRRDPSSGRQAGLIVRRAAPTARSTR
jgi:polyphenol oxidase